jgi:hypothetical protein
MKGTLILLVGLALCVFTAESYGIQAELPNDTTKVTAQGNAKITIGGDIRVRGTAQGNTNTVNGNNTNSGASGSSSKDRPRLK